MSAQTQPVVAATYLTFILGEELYALDVANVREVLDLTTITKVPRTAEFLRGVINLRGHVAPVIDLRSKLGLPEIRDTVETCIIVTEVQLEGDTTVIGAIADAVREVVEIDEDSIEPPPRVGNAHDTRFLRGLARLDGRFAMILNIDHVFSADELELAMAVRESTAILEEMQAAVEAEVEAELKSEKEAAKTSKKDSKAESPPAQSKDAKGGDGKDGKSSSGESSGGGGRRRRRS